MTLSPGAGGGTLIPPSAADELTAPLQLPASVGIVAEGRLSRAGQTITLTYSVAPTWQWLAL
ncbi:MAG: hypothetical protein M0Z88_03990 [Actinomycetota bacterium]|nr:hypothetical protein [Actinomycetota bacterium]